ncbi:ABC transporter substrate-binding protein [Clostridiales bacterium COT073_COT-073]|nr:ABC transporter substrate-binding protein [Clostridiales bacterium COT073_COT-073]
MKKWTIILSLMLLLTACAGPNGKTETSGQDQSTGPVTVEKQDDQDKAQTKTNNDTKTEQVYQIGILQIAEHSALDENREGFIKALENAGLNVKIDYKNAQGDVTNALAMAKKFVDDQVDLIFAIATPAAQATKQATKDSNIPVLFSAVTDPVGAQLVESWESPAANITGTSDQTPTRLQLEIFQQLNQDIKTVGIIYNTGETNSESQLRAAEKEAAEIGLTILPVGITTINDIPKAMEVMLAKTDAMYALTDNLVAASLDLISHLALERKYIIVQSYIDETDAAEGILISNGFSYYDLGGQTGEMAVRILKGEKKAAEIPVLGAAEQTENMVRQKALEAIGIDPELEIIKKARMK